MRRRSILVVFICGLTVAAASWIVARHWRPSVHQMSDAARELAILCQSMPGRITSECIGISWLPESIRSLKPGIAVIEPNRATLVLESGFRHRGYVLARDDSKSSPGTALWRLYSRDDDQETLLCTIQLDPSRRLHNEEIVRAGLAGLDRRIAVASHDIGSYRQKFYFLIEFEDRRAARRLCEDAAEALPEHWWPQLTAALMDSTGPEALDAAGRFADWVSRHPSFAHWVYLAYFYDAVGDHEQACEAALRSAEYPIASGKDDDCDGRVLAYTAAHCAFRNECFDTAAVVAEGALERTGAPDSFYLDFVQIAAASRFLDGDTDRAIRWLQVAEGSKVSGARRIDLGDLGPLNAAIREQDGEAAKACVDSALTRFDPYCHIPVQTIRGSGQQDGAGKPAKRPSGPG